MNINITGSDFDLNTYTLPTPFWLTFESDIDAPADALTLTFLGSDIPNIPMIKITGDFFFDGMVDLITRKTDGDGEKTVLHARSLAGILLDSEISPGVRRIDDLTDVLWFCDCGGKLKGFLYDSYTPIGSMNFPKGTSAWRFLKTFCEQTMGYTPRISDDGYIISKPYSFDTVHDFDNVTPLAIQNNIDYTTPVTSVSVRNERGIYSTIMLNTNVYLPYLRTRHIIPGVSWVNFPELAAEKTIKESMLRHRTTTFTFPEIFSAKVGDGGVYNGEEKVVISVKHKLDGTGVKSVITIADREYL